MAFYLVFDRIQISLINYYMKQMSAPSKIVILLSLAVASVLIRTSSAYSIVKNYDLATLKKQVKYASSIFEGRVKRVMTIIPLITYATLLEDYTIIRNDHYVLSLSTNKKLRNPRNLEIHGFDRSSTCDPASPRVGSRVIVYVCPNSDSSSWQTGTSDPKWRRRYWSLNRIAMGVGVVTASNSNLRKVRRLARRFQFMPASQECSSRPE